MKHITIILLLAAILPGCYRREATTTGLEGKPMPAFSLLLTDSSTRLNTKSIPEGKPVVLCYVGTHCPYSRAEIQDIVDNMKDFKDVRLYIFTTDPFKAMKSFSNHYELSKYPNVTVGVDTAAGFPRYFQTPGVPYTAIYTKDKKLIKAYAGIINASLIKDVALE